MSPLSAAGFRDSIGVNTHMSYTNTAYGDWPKVLQALSELGVTHVRDGVFDNGVPSFMADWDARYQEAVSQRIRFDLVMPEPGSNLGSVPKIVGEIAGTLRDGVEDIEAPNEYDLAVGGSAWSSTLAGYDEEIHDDVLGTPGLAGVSIIGPSLVDSASYGELGGQSATFDYGNIHPYALSTGPSHQQIASAMATERIVSGQQPIMATEVGFDNALTQATNQPATSDDAAAVYLLRTFLENYAAGIVRTYAYELVDEQPDPAGDDAEDNFGLLNYDFTPKPAYTALKNLLTDIGEPAAPTTLAPLDVDLSNPNGAVQPLLLEVDPTHYDLILWQQATVWNPVTEQDLTVPPVEVSVAAPGVVSAAMDRPLVSDAENSVDVVNGALSVSVPADPVVVSLTVSSNGGSASGGSSSSGGAGSRTTTSSSVSSSSKNPSTGSVPGREHGGSAVTREAKGTTGRRAATVARPASASLARGLRSALAHVGFEVRTKSRRMQKLRLVVSQQAGLRLLVTRELLRLKAIAMRTGSSRGTVGYGVTPGEPVRISVHCTIGKKGTTRAYEVQLLVSVASAQAGADAMSIQVTGVQSSP